jgi:hypothetical protein
MAIARVRGSTLPRLDSLGQPAADRRRVASKVLVLVFLARDANGLLCFVALLRLRLILARLF